VVDAVRAALRPPGPTRWIAEAVDDRIELRTAIRRWSTVAEPSASLARIACGTALRAARLAIAVQGRQPLVSYPEGVGALAVLHAGGAVAASRRDVLLHGVLLGHAPAPSVGPPGRTAIIRWLHHGAESEGTWLCVLPDVPSVAPGPCWDGPHDDARRRGRPSAMIIALVGASGRLPVADLRIGQALETIRLTATALGLDSHVLAAPTAPTTETAPHIAIGTRSLALIRVVGRGRRGEHDARPDVRARPDTAAVGLLPVLDRPTVSQVTYLPARASSTSYTEDT
jgi:hypothetical protein